MRIQHPAFENGEDQSTGLKFSIEVVDGPSWRLCVSETRTAVCALCGRRINLNESCYTATYRADRGSYMRNYHVTCSYLARVWGESPVFANPGRAERWATRYACEKCDRWGGCPMNAFDCQRAITYLTARANAKSSRIAKEYEMEDENDETDIH